MPAYSSSERFNDSVVENVLPSPRDKPTDEVVISGISCRLPESDSLEEFKYNLFHGVDMCTEDGRRWEPGLYGLPKRSGKLKDITKFDAAFFGVSPKQAQCLDAQIRLLLEVTYEAIVDAGYDPAEFRGSNTGVYVGVSSGEAAEAWAMDPETLSGYGMIGCQRAMIPNRLSFFFDLKGPSYAVDTACSSSLMAMENALRAIRNGQCSAALVAGVNLTLKPQTAMQFMKLGMLSPEGKCKSFDAEGNGYCRSEGAVVVLLQRPSVARRVYATVVHAKSNTDGFKEQGVTYPSGLVQRQLLEEIYSEAGINPNTVAYLEAHGTGTKVGDPQELKSVTDVFCKGRQSPLLIGSVKSNMGHAEPASGLAAVAKVLISMEEGKIPGNLHFQLPNPEIPGLIDGRLCVVEKTTPLPGQVVAINSFGFGGANVHVILKAPEKKCATLEQNRRLLTAASRTLEGVESLLHAAQQHAANADFLTLLMDTVAQSPVSMPYRGFTVVNGNNQPTEISKVPSNSRPIWFICSGMGTQWSGMGREFMVFSSFKASVQKSAEALKCYGIDLCDVIMHGERITQDMVLSFAGIAAIQVALIDLLASLSIHPDGIIGHSVGELACAYADNCLTAEETVLCAYWRGRCVSEAKLAPGGMAAVGLTWEEAKRRCPEGVAPACHNAEDSVTISGPADTISEFVAELEKENVFAREVACGGVAFHSYCMRQTEQSLRAALNKVIRKPKPRSQKWISTSIPESQWNSELASFSSADYHVNNLLNPVLFHDGLSHLPANAIAIEIAPHCLLQAILKRSLSKDCTILGLMSKREEDNVDFFLTNLGRCYLQGVSMKLEKLYPPINYPVAPGTPHLASFIRWDHSQTWDCPRAEHFLLTNGTGSCTFEIDTSSESAEAFVFGHVIDGRVLYPATGYLVLAWKALAKITGQSYETLPVQFENVKIHRATILHRNSNVKLSVSIMTGTGSFEVTEANALVVSGQVSFVTDQRKLTRIEAKASDTDSLTSKDIYKELRLWGYDYTGEFQGIVAASLDGSQGKLAWKGNWVAFVDTMLQLSILSQPGRCLRLPTRIQRLVIDPNVQENSTEHTDDQTVIHAHMDHILNRCTAGGVEISGLHATSAPRRQQQHATPTLEKVDFVPYVETFVPSTELVTYAEACEALAFHIAKSLSTKKLIHNGGLFSGCNDVCKSLPGDVEYLVRKNRKDHLLLEMLCSIKNEIEGANANDIIKKTVSAYKDVMENDVLLSSLRSARALKTVLDVVVENIPGTKLKVVQVGCDNCSVLKRIQRMLNSHPQTNVHLVACTGESGFEADEDVDAVVEWNLTGSPPPAAGAADLAIAHNVFPLQADARATLKNISSCIKDGGFILVHEVTSRFMIGALITALANDVPAHSNGRKFGFYYDESTWSHVFNEVGFDVVAQKSDGLTSTLFLLRKKCPIETKPNFVRVTNGDFSWIRDLKNLLQAEDGDRKIWVVADENDVQKQSGIVGLVNCLRQESGGHRIRCLYNVLSTEEEFCQLTETEWQKLLERDLVMNIRKAGFWGSFRHLPLTEGKERVLAEHAYVNALTRGDLSSLCWIHSPIQHLDCTEKPHLCLYNVHYASLNFRDIMLATGKLPPDAIPGHRAMQDCLLGMEFSGTDQNGKRVMGLVPARGLATAVMADKRYTWTVPEAWSLQDAATIPIAYSTVYYALIVRGRLRKGEKVLIHSGSGAVGQAAISVALHLGCEVFTTVGSSEKRKYLKERFPQLDSEHISHSRDLTFEQEILQATNGRGVDVVLNSLADDKLQASVRLLATHGRFLEIGKFDLSNDSSLGMSVFLKNVSFHGILLDALFDDANPDWALVHKLLKEGIECGAVTPLQTTLFNAADIEAAFRFMAQGKHIGKVVIKVRDDILTRENRLSVSAIQKTRCHSLKSYVITGGLGGFGLELAQWLIERGARHIILTSRSGVRTGYQLRRLKEWRDMGVNVCPVKLDVSTAEETEELLCFAQKFGPLGGIFHLAAVLLDALFENQTEETFRKVCFPKCSGTYNLDCATRKKCGDSLDWFVVFSSVSCGRGNIGQANYGFANSVMERICEQRKEDGHPALAIQWGAIGDVGMVQETMGENETNIGGTVPQRMISCLEVLDEFLNQPNSVVSSFVLAEKQTGATCGSKIDLPSVVGNILGVKDLTNVNPDVTLGEFGLDSLMGVEVKQTLERDFDLSLSMQNIRQLTFNQLGDISGGKTIATSKSAAESKEAQVVRLKRRFDFTCMMPKNDIVKLNDVSDGEPIFFIHPIEGSVIALRDIAKALKCPMYGLQCTHHTPLDSIETVARFYIEKICATQPHLGSFNLVGYSFGGCVAFDMALQLEGSDRNVKLVLLDASHAYVAAHTESYTESMSVTSESFEAESLSEALCAFMMQFMDIDYQKVKAELLEADSQESRLCLTSSMLCDTGLFSESADVLEMAALSFYRKLLIADRYQVSGRLRSNVTLIRAADGHKQGEKLGQDYGLNQVCSGEVNVFSVPGTHETFLNADGAERIADIVKHCCFS